MKMEHITSAKAHDLKSRYAQCVAVSGHSRTIYVSGQIPVRPDGTVPETFKEQAEQAWANVEAQLKAAGLGLENIVRHTTYLSDRKYRAENSLVRKAVLGGHEPALTVIIAGIFDEAWLLEIEAVAAG
ncbi:RidA family protein [Hoeflea prorocentri]|uniref:RidA family protein n=1 Tax=Hoeflea prorocentri TaxID=1922333 RepID=A0A9X3ZIL5_9HYPH|nr:RidA family protein [Hoeflea prorocentri]MCY6382574.1 RidA family protein [Hoeflea prorocentri]MDA5400374.1 RidA family protein [Hoeflea prorocentri]